MKRKEKSIEIFGKTLKELRLERGLTQEELAELATMTDRSHISALERAERSPLFPTILSLAKALNMSASDLVARVEKNLTK